MAVKSGAGGVTEIGTWDYVWSAITEADEGTPITVPGHVRDIAFQVAGTFGAGTFQLQGSNDGTNYSALKDVGGTTVGSTDTTIWRVSNLPKFIKPKATAGTAASVIAMVHGSVFD